MAKFIFTGMKSEYHKGDEIPMINISADDGSGGPTRSIPGIMKAKFSTSNLTVEVSGVYDFSQKLWNFSHSPGGKDIVITSTSNSVIVNMVNETIDEACLGILVGGSRLVNQGNKSYRMIFDW